MIRNLFIIAIGVLLCLWADAEATTRSRAQVRAFMHAHPCPGGVDKGSTRRCRGYVVDHRHGLCMGGRDAPDNMMWMTVAAAKAKDRWECKPGWNLRLNACDADQAACTGVR